MLYVVHIYGEFCDIELKTGTAISCPDAIWYVSEVNSSQFSYCKNMAWFQNWVSGKKIDRSPR